MAATKALSITQTAAGPGAGGWHPPGLLSTVGLGKGHRVVVEGDSAPKSCLKHPWVHTVLYVETLVHACAGVPMHTGTLHASL